MSVEINNQGENNAVRQSLPSQIIVPESIFDVQIADEVKDYIRSVVSGKEIRPKDTKPSNEGYTWYNIGSIGNSEISKNLSLLRYGRVEFPFGIVVSIVKFHEFLNGNITLEQLRDKTFRIKPGRTIRKQDQEQEPVQNYKALMLAYFLTDIRRNEAKRQTFVNSEILPYSVVVTGKKIDTFTMKPYFVDYIEKNKYSFIMSCYVLCHYLAQTNQLSDKLIREIVELNRINTVDLYAGIPVKQFRKPESNSEEVAQDEVRQSSAQDFLEFAKELHGEERYLVNGDATGVESSPVES